MEKLINSVINVISKNKQLPFSVYSCLKEQNIVNVPIIKPMLIFVLSGVKELGKNNRIICPAGSFIFLSNRPTIDMRNIPNNHEYFALLIEFEHDDFNVFKEKPIDSKEYINGEIAPVLENTLQQFIEWSLFAPVSMWSHRRQEILQLMYYLGYEGVSSMVGTTSITNKLQQIINKDISAELHADFLCEQLAMSESTLRRKLKLEGASIQKIKNQVRLGHALHLVQSTIEPIGHIAEQCGYQSQSRFTEKFKQLFGLTPTQLRKTKMHD